MKKLDRKITVTLITLAVALAVLALAAVAYRILIFHFEYGTVLDDSHWDEYIYNTLYFTVIISMYAAGIAFLVLSYLLIKHFINRNRKQASGAE